MKITAAATILGTLVGGYTESCIGDQDCWEPKKYEAPADCQEAPLPPSCIVKELAEVLMEVSAPITENPKGAAVGGIIGLVSGMLLSTLAGRLDGKKKAGKI